MLLYRNSNFNVHRTYEEYARLAAHVTRVVKQLNGGEGLDVKHISLNEFSVNGIVVTFETYHEGASTFVRYLYNGQESQYSPVSYFYRLLHEMNSLLANVESFFDVFAALADTKYSIAVFHEGKNYFPYKTTWLKWHNQRFHLSTSANRISDDAIEFHPQYIDPFVSQVVVNKPYLRSLAFKGEKQDD